MKRIYSSPKNKVFAAFIPQVTPIGELIGNALIVDGKIARDDYFTSIVVDPITVEISKKLQKEITKEIPYIHERELLNLNERGIIRAGSEIKNGDILVGMVAPQEEHNLGPEEKLLRAIFGESSSQLQDISLRMPYGEGIVLKTECISSKEELPKGIDEIVKVYIAVMRKLKSGDVLQDQSGNRGVVIKIDELPISAKYGGYEIGVIGGSDSDFINGLGFCEKTKIWYNKRLGLKFGDKAKYHKFMGVAKVGILNLEKITQLSEKKITASSCGPYDLNWMPMEHDPNTGLRIRATVSEKELSALKKFPELVKNVFSSSDSPRIMNKMYEALIKNGEY